MAQAKQCVRCHEGPGLDPVPLERSCVGCHQALFTDHFDDAYQPEALAHWRTRVHSLVAVPSLHGASRLRADWVDAYLARPHDVRPGVPAEMPRLPLSDAERAALVRWLDADTALTENDPADADPTTGLRLMEARGCVSCHAYSGSGLAPPHDPPTALAPDLRWARDRMTAGSLDAWLQDPAAIKPDTVMPRPRLSAAERAQVVAALTRLPLAPQERPAVPTRLPPLDRPVTYAEVEARVFHAVCWHCHTVPSSANGGDGGPGSTGGLGFAGAGLDLGSHAGILQGKLGPGGARVSVLDGDPSPLVAAMLRRHEELAGEQPAARGMPLGLEPIPVEDIQLVDSWIQQGAPP